MSYLIFTDQKSFMRYFAQEPGPDMVALYRKLIIEEDAETNDALDAYDIEPSPESVTDIADGLLDGIYVRIGLLHALGLDPQALWDEVQRSNVAKLKHECKTCNASGHVIDVNYDIPVGGVPLMAVCPDCNGGGIVHEVRRREDGKVLKPDDWTPPNLLPLVVAALSKGGA